MGEWQLIETAPKGGEHPYSPNLEDRSTYILGWNSYHTGVVWGQIELGQLEWWGEDGEPVEPPPTHWMPLPTPPEPAP